VILLFHSFPGTFAFREFSISFILYRAIPFVTCPLENQVLTMKSNIASLSGIIAFQTFSNIHAFSIHNHLHGRIIITRTNDHITSTNLQAVTPKFEEVCETTGVTLTRFMHEVERCNPELQELAQLFSGIQTASKAITNLVKRSQLPNSSVLGLEGAINVQGEDQKVCKICTEMLLSIYFKYMCVTDTRLCYSQMNKFFIET
jgi:hypothetical protein